jgi:hypothetical protein
MKQLLFVSFFIATVAFAQNPIGKITNVKTVVCPAGFAAGSSCEHQTIESCPYTTEIGVTIGTKAPAASKGTIVLFNGSNGTQPMGGPNVTDYFKYGFTVIDTMWDAPGWEGTGEAPNILSGACRPATLINYLAQSAKGAFCGQGRSAGSSALAYSMAQYGIDQLDYVELLSGPVMSDMEQGCKTPDVPPVRVGTTNGVPFMNGPQYVNQFIPAVSAYTGQVCQPHLPTPQSANEAWLGQSIVQSDSLLSYSRTGISGWVCDNGLNNSAAQGAIFYSALASSYSLTRISNCSGSEGVQSGTTPQGVKGQQAIEQDMELSCMVRQ